jgi:UDP-N-acetylenolpyruvoylglucosamine reductase
VLVIGRGSNLLVADTGFRGVALTLAGELEQLAIDAPRGASARGRRRWRCRCSRAARRRPAVGGLEFFVGIPGRSAARCG